MSMLIDACAIALAVFLFLMAVIGSGVLAVTFVQIWRWKPDDHDQTFVYPRSKRIAVFNARTNGKPSGDESVTPSTEVDPYLQTR